MSPLAASILRWLARLSALFFACVFLLILVREFLAPQYGPPVSAVEWAGVAFLLIAAAGMVLAWKWGLTGALISIAALVLHISVVRNRTYAVIWFAAIPLVLFVADLQLHRLRPPARTTTP